MNTKSAILKKKGVIMFYKIINSGKYKTGRVLLNYILILSYFIFANSCMTTRDYFTNPEYLKTEQLEDINIIELKNGTVIEGKDKLIQIGRNADSTMYLRIWSEDQVKSKEHVDNNTVKWSKVQISEKDIKKIQMTDSKVNVPVTLLLIFGILVVLFAVGIGTAKLFDGNIAPSFK